MGSVDPNDRAWRVWGRAAWLIAALFATLVPHALWRLAGQPSPWPRHFLRAAARASGVRVTVAGTPCRPPVFFVANHLSWTDICILGGVVETSFVAQDMIAGWPVIGWMARLNDTVFVSRTDRRSAGDQVARLRLAIARPRPVTLFPEGTTTDGRSLLPFKTPLFEGLAPPPPGLMVQPVHLDFDDAGKALAWIGTEGAPANARRTLARRGSFGVTVRFLEPFDPAGMDRKAIAATARARIAASLA
ncbi:1-acyl-sn-glycerol-3-phosphate acyltransferase [Glacieibacterium frigidum]|uniref:1-acyl-sn-glycerol-3-phosphate acyltransferase n=2 Tax=Glacieibacterium frigidum TaxID=2593303 RepID=A0A552UAM6_9SPHN|nr:1-acyl-sn-glycerol-3-phosphate acyltransferase [Glacieibacterium frigidum]